MPGNYVVNPRSNGEGIDAPKYLADHQLHIDNLEPAKIDDYSGSVGQMQASTDPGELSSESQPTSLSGELERLRWAIRQATGMAQWYQTPPTDLTALNTSLSLVNRTGTTLAAGESVGLDTAADSGVVLQDVLASTQPLLFARGAVAIAASGPFVNSGLVAVKVTGAVVRGNWLVKSATTKTLQDSGVALGAAVPVGGVGVALTAAVAGMVTALLVGASGGGAGRPTLDLSAVSATFPTANFPQLVKQSGANWTGYTLGYDSATGESCFWERDIPLGTAFSTASIRIVSRQAAAITGTVGWIITTRMVGVSEAWDVAGVADTATAVAVPGTAGQLTVITKVLTVTGWAAGKRLQIKITRDVANDTVAEDALFMGATIELT